MAGGNIKGITIEIGGDTTKLSSALSQADKALKNTQKQLSEVERSLKFDPGNTDLLKDKQVLLADKINETKNKLEALQKAQKELDAEGVDKNSEEYKELQVQIDTTKSKLDGLNDEMKEFGSAGAQALQVAGSKISETGDKISGVGEKLTAGVTGPIVAAGAAAGAAWTEVDSAMDTIVTKTGASGAALDDMQQRAQNIATTIPTSFQSAGDAVGEVNTRFGATGDQLEQLSTQFIEFATINNQDVSGSIDTVQAAMAAYGLSADQAGLMLDTLNKAGQDTGVDVLKLASDMTTNSEALQEMGFNASDSAMFLANLDKSGVDPSGLKLTVTYATGDDVYASALQLYQVNLRQLGIDLELKSMEWDQKWAQAQNTDPKNRQDMFLFIWWPDYADPVSWFTSLLHSEDEIVYNLSYLHDEALDALIDEAVELTVTDRDAAEANYIEAQKIVADQAYYLNLYDQVHTYVVSNSVDGVAENPAYSYTIDYYQVTAK